MLILRLDTANTVIVTATEKATLDDPVWLFQFKNQTTGDSVYCIATDVSDYDYRYNKFVITETSSPNNLNGEVDLVEAGLYDYFVYEQESTTNLDPDLATSLCEQGFMRVAVTTAPYANYDDQDKTYTVYNG